MAHVLKTGGEIRRDQRLRELRDIPFILLDDGDYPAPLNEYLWERARGAIRVGSKDANLRLRPLTQRSAYILANHLADVLTWAETQAAHPILGAIHWSELRAWHILHLYQDALLEGLWSESFFKNGKPKPLDPEYVRAKVDAALACYSWMSAKGHIRAFEAELDIRELQNAKHDALLSYRAEMRSSRTTSSSLAHPAVRGAFNDFWLPSVDDLVAFFEAIPNTPHRLAAMLMFETGMRAEEVVENTLLPGLQHVRDVESGRWYNHPAWDGRVVLTAHNLSDDRMIGVMPGRDVAWKQKAHIGRQLDYRIIGKNAKVRRVRVPAALMRRIWGYHEVQGTLRRDEARPNAAVFRNQYGAPLSYHAIWEAFDTANRSSCGKERITPHDLRRAFACHFLERGITTRAARLGYADGNIPFEVMMAIGQDLLLVIKEELGHTELRTTEIYLKQVISGKLRPAALADWNSFLDQEFKDG